MNISTVDELINELGGTGAFAKLFGVVPSAVSNYRAAERFPARLHYRLDRLAKKRGIKLPKDFFEEAVTPNLPGCLP